MLGGESLEFQESPPPPPPEMEAKVLYKVYKIV